MIFTCQECLAGWFPSAETALPPWWHQRGSTAEEQHIQAQWKVNIQYVRMFQPHSSDFMSGKYLSWLCSFNVSGQRKEYSETLNKQSDNIHVRVEVSLYESAWRHTHTSWPVVPTLSSPPLWTSTAPVHLWHGWPGAKDAGRLHVQAQEAGCQKSPVAPGDDHGGSGGISSALWHRDQGWLLHASGI